MLWSRFHHLPVVDDDKRLVGIISTLDLLAAFVKATANGKNEDTESTESGDDTVEGVSAD